MYAKVQNCSNNNISECMLCTKQEFGSREKTVKTIFLYVLSKLVRLYREDAVNSNTGKGRGNGKFWSSRKLKSS